MRKDRKLLALGLFGTLVAFLFRRQISEGVGALMRLSQRGLDFLKQEEGLRLWKYLDAAGHETIGYGHKIEPGETFPETISNEYAETLLRDDTERFQKAIRRLVRVPLNQNQFDALVSWAFNVGEQAVKNSTLLRVLNKGNYAQAADELLRWKFAGGKPILLARRERERELFLS